MAKFFDFLIDSDKSTFLFINSNAGTQKLFDSLFRIIASDYMVPVILCLTLIFLWFRDASEDTSFEVRRKILISIGALLVSCFIVMVFNQLFFRERPFNLSEAKLLFYAATDSSFPSNSTAAVFGLSIPILKASKRIGIMMILGSLCLAVSRVYVGVHFPGDVIGGILVALLAIWITNIVFKEFNTPVTYALGFFENSKWMQAFRI